MAELTSDQTTAISTIIATVASRNYDYKIRRALVEAIAAATSLEITHNRMKLLASTDNALSLFVSTADADRIHGWMVTRRRGEGARQRVGASGTQPAIFEQTSTYVVMGAHYYAFGEDSGTSHGGSFGNTEDAFGLECDKVVAAINAVTSLFDGAVIMQPISYTTDLVPNAGKLVHLFVGEITVEFDYCS